MNDKPQSDDWTGEVKLSIQGDSLPAAGAALCELLNFALKVQATDEQFFREVDSCVKLFWERCNRESRLAANSGQEEA